MKAKTVLDYMRSKEWAVFVTGVTALLSQLPALAELVQGELDSGEWTPTGLLILVAGFIIRGNVFSRDTHEQVASRKGELELEVLAAHEERISQRGRELAATAVLEAARQGLPFPGVNVAEQPAHPDELV